MKDEGWFLQTNMSILIGRWHFAKAKNPIYDAFPRFIVQNADSFKFQHLILMEGLASTQFGFEGKAIFFIISSL